MEGDPSDKKSLQVFWNPQGLLSPCEVEESGETPTPETPSSRWGSRVENELKTKNTPSNPLV